MNLCLKLWQLFSRKALATALWLVLFSAIIEPAIAQQPFSYPLAPDAIPSQEVYRVIQDEKGYIWLGCNAGLFRYDGAAFKQYSNAEMSGRALSNLELDATGNLWCGSFTAQVFQIEKDELKLFVDWSKKTKQFPAFRTIDEGVLMTSDSGLYRIMDDGSMKRFKVSSTDHSNVDAVYINHKKQVLVFSNWNGIYQLAEAKNELTELSMPNDFDSFREGRAFFIEWQDKTLVLLQRHIDSKVVWAEIRDGKIQPFSGFETSAIQSKVNRVCSDKKGRVWVCTNAGALLFDERKVKHFLPGNRVSDVFEDREGNFWFATLDKGIFVAPSLEITHFGTEYFGEKLANISALGQTKNGDVLLGHFDGSMSSFDPNSSTKMLALKSEIGKHRSVEHILTEKDRSYIARGPLTLINNGRTVDFAEGGNAKDLLFWNEDTLLIATVLGLSKLYPNGKTGWEREMLREGTCRKVSKTSKGVIWAAFKDGVYCGDDKKLNPFLKDGKPVFAADIQVDASDNLWIATISNGLMKVSDGKISKEFTSSNGLGSDNLHCMALANDTVWIANANSLDRLVNGKFVHFGLLDGMPLKEVNDILVSHGNVYLASHNGLTVVPTSSNPVNAMPPLLITNTILLGDSLVSNSENVSFNYTFNELKVDFSVLAFRSRGSCKVKYRLSGLDTTWTEQKGNHIEIIYNALPAGNFQFEAFALNEDGVQSEEFVSFSFTINPPFWQTWWFYLLVAVLSIGLVSGLFLLRIRYINRKAALEHAVVSSKLAALRSQMNPHFLFNALNSIQELVLSKDTKNAIRYLGTFSGLTRTILENSAKETVRLSEEIDMLKQYLELEKLRFGDTLEINVEVSSEIDTEGIKIPPMLIQPYVENALKHGLLHLRTDRKLHLKFEQQKDFLLVSIEDNGVGRAKAEEIAKQKKKHQSFSSEATENRLQSMKNEKGVSGSVEVVDLYKDEEPAGTKVVLKIPYRQS